MFEETLKVYIDKEPYIQSFELNLFSHCFNMKDLNMNIKHFEHLKKDLVCPATY